MRNRPLVLLLSLTALAAAPPAAKKVPTTETIQGVAIPDDYRWLESDDKQVAKWTKAQSKVARAELDAIPALKPLQARIGTIMRAASPEWYSLVAEGGVVFALKDQPPLQQPLLVTLGEHGDRAAEKVVLDMNVFDPTGDTAIDMFEPSHDGKLVAVALSRGGSESGDVHVFDVATGKERTADTVVRVTNGTSGGSVAWKPDGSGFWYTRHAHAGERPDADYEFFEEVWWHTLGADPKKDTYVIGKKEFPRIAEVFFQASDDGRYVLMDVLNGDGGEHAFWLGEDGRFTRLSHFSDRLIAAQWGPDDALYLESLYTAPRGRLLRLDPTKGELDVETAPLVVPETDGAIAGFVATASTLYVADLLGGPSRLRAYPTSGGAASEVALPSVASVDGLARLGADDVLANVNTYTMPPGWYRVTGTALAKTELVGTSPVDFSDVEVTREMATSKDGTQIPMTILARKGTPRDGKNPTILYGYGGYGVNLSPWFSAERKVWLEQGGVLAIANLRGGGEFGDEWHTMGNLTKKQNVFDDFAACAQHLIDARYTSRSKLGIHGESNGGLLMNAEITQHPELFGAVVSEVGISDMIHVEHDPNGAFNVTEYGTVGDPAQFEALYAYSPYHHVKDGTDYPPILLTTGANDPRVEPYHSWKMGARLQAADPTGRILLLTRSGTGHGIGDSLDEKIAHEADTYAFFSDALGVQYAAVVN